MPALRSLFVTTDSHAQLVLRIGLGFVILPHGLQKVFGWFGGFGLSGTMQFFTDTMGLPWLLGLAAIVAESVGALLVMVGAATRIAAAAIGVTMTTAMLMVHAEHGFFMNWFGTQSGEGVEFFLLAIALAVGLVLGGGGALSLDRVISRRPREPRRAS